MSYTLDLIWLYPQRWYQLSRPGVTNCILVFPDQVGFGVSHFQECMDIWLNKSIRVPTSKWCFFSVPRTWQVGSSIHGKHGGKTVGRSINFWCASAANGWTDNSENPMGIPVKTSMMVYMVCIMMMTWYVHGTWHGTSTTGLPRVFRGEAQTPWPWWPFFPGGRLWSGLPGSREGAIF